MRGATPDPLSSSPAPSQTVLNPVVAGGGLPPTWSLPAAGPDPRSEWARSVMPDGREVPDEPTATALFASVGSPAVWRTSGSEVEKQIIPSVSLIAGLTAGGVAYYVDRMASASVAASLAVMALASVAGTAVFYLWIRRALRRQLSGKGARSIMYLPPALATPEAAGRLVAAAAAAAGRSASGPAAKDSVTTWQLDAPIRFYFTPMPGSVAGRFIILAEGRDQADLFRRLKGHVLDAIARQRQIPREDATLHEPVISPRPKP